MRKNLKGFYIVLLVFILSVIGKYGSYLQSEDVFSTQIQRQNKKLSQKEKNTKVYASGVPIGIYVKTEGILVLGLQQVECQNGKSVCPAACKIKAGDYILTLNGQKITTKQQFIHLLQKNREKEIVLTIKRKKKIIKIKIKFKNSESGASGGLMMSLSIYDSFIKEDLTKGLKIAGTGTIDQDGNVGKIDGVKYKVMGAVKDKADIFLVPAGSNYKEAIKTKKEKKYKIKIIKVKTLDEAISKLKKNG